MDSSFCTSSANAAVTEMEIRQSVKADSHTACRAHAVPLPCRAAKGLECVFPILFTQCGRVWFTLAMPCPCHDPTMLCCGLEKNSMVGSWHGHGMASVNQTRQHCVNQMGKTHSKPLAARDGRGRAWVQHGHGMLCESAFIFILVWGSKMLLWSHTCR